MDVSTINYSVAIRTLGKAGEYYQRTLNSIASQTVKPEAVVVYIAEGYDQPKETVGIERYVYVPKGMVAQRALQYEEIDSEWIMFLDDDVFLPPNAVETLFCELGENGGDVISPATFANHKASLKQKVIRTLTGREIPRLFDDGWSYKVLRTAGFSYNNNPRKAVNKTQSGSGPCFMCRKKNFLDTHFEEELWLDEAPYAYPEDQVMFYKMYLNGLKLLTSFDSGIVHLDAGSTMAGSEERMNKHIYSEYRNKTIFWRKFIYPNRPFKLLSLLAFWYMLGVQYLKYFTQCLMGRKARWQAFRKGLREGMNF